MPKFGKYLVEKNIILALKYLRSFAEAWTDEKIVQQVVGKSPREHNLALLGKLKNSEDRICYAKKAIENNWSRNVLVMQIESKLIG